MSGCSRYFFVLSFEVLKETGVAICIANDEIDAGRQLRSSGRYCKTPDSYVIARTLNVGSYDGMAYGLMLESYANAEVVYLAFAEMAEKIKGEKGDKGDRGEKGEDGRSPLLVPTDVFEELEKHGLVDPEEIYYVYEEEE